MGTPDAASSFRARSAGTSMWPCIRSGDILSVEIRGSAPLKPGDIVVYKRFGRLFAHRLLEKVETGNQTFLLTRGDACPEVDLLLPSAAVLGRVKSIIRDDQVVELSTRPNALLGTVIAHLSNTGRTVYYAVRALRALNRITSTLDEVFALGSDADVEA